MFPRITDKGGLGHGASCTPYSATPGRRRSDASGNDWAPPLFVLIFLCVNFNRGALFDFMIQFTHPLHHAYGVSGEADALVPEILEALAASVQFAARGNPDFREERYELLGIDEAHALKEAAGRTAVTGGLPAAPGRPAQAGKKIFVVSARGITKDAQNALLKIFEEPPADTHFFLIVPSFNLLLPTLHSRLSILQVSDSRGGREILAEEFLAKPAPARIALVQEMLKALQQEKDDKADSPEPLREKERIMEFLSALERALAGTVWKNGDALAQVLVAKRYSRDRAPSFKLLLEHLALVLPRQ